MKEFNYSTDGGSLMLGTEEFKAHYSNGYGDGNFTVYIDESGKAPTRNVGSLLIALKVNSMFTTTTERVQRS